MLLSVVIPMYNEESNVRGTIDTLMTYLLNLKIEFEVIFSDDGSRDCGAGIVSALSEKYNRIKLICSPENRGKGAALKMGIRKAAGKYIVFTDCDLAYGAGSVGKILEKLQTSGADVVAGSRAIHPDGYGDYPKIRRFFSEKYLKIVKKKAGFSHSDSQCGIKGFKSEAAKRLYSDSVIDGFATDLEILMLADKYGYKVLEYPVRVLRHSSNASKIKMITDSYKMLHDIKIIKKTHGL